MATLPPGSADQLAAALAAAFRLGASDNMERRVVDVRGFEPERDRSATSHAAGAVARAKTARQALRQEMAAHQARNADPRLARHARGHAHMAVGDMLPPVQSAEPEVRQQPELAELHARLEQAMSPELTPEPEPEREPRKPTRSCFCWR